MPLPTVVIHDDTPINGYSVGPGFVYHVVQTCGELRQLLLRDYLLACEEAEQAESAEQAALAKK